MQRLSPADIPEDAILIDVRDELEAAAAPLSKLTDLRVVTVPLSDLEDGAMPELPAGARVVVVCGTGTRGELAGAYLQAAGTENISVLDGGARALKRSLERGNAESPDLEAKL
jgi:rhodanese-related sulfurtransferase